MIHLVPYILYTDTTSCTLLLASWIPKRHPFPCRAALQWQVIAPRATWTRPRGGDCDSDAQKLTYATIH